MAKQKIQIDIKRAEELASLGLTQEQIAGCLGISERTLYNRKRESEELSIAIERGTARGIEQIANALFESALGGNITAMIFFLKTRAGWSEKQYLEYTAKKEDREKQDRQRELEELSNEQLLEILRFNELEREQNETLKNRSNIPEKVTA